MKEIWQFLLVLLAAIVFAFALVYWMVRDDAIDKRMYVSQVLLSPETIEKLSNREVEGGKQRPSEYLIESIQYTHFDETTKKWVTKDLDIATYARFYHQIEGDRGVIDPSEAILQSFNSSNGAKILIYMKHFAPLVREGKTELFQTLQFNQEQDAYRINLHVEDKQKEWVYFSHPEAEKLLE